MNKYREAAVLAVELLNNEDSSDPAEAWEKAAKKTFPSSVSLQDKGCPKGAFLGLCNEGMIEGLAPGRYSKPSKNGEYAVQAVEILRKNRFLVSQPEMLWKKIAGTKSQNHQMDVVIGLWEQSLIST
jgi:hypothetical protein